MPCFSILNEHKDYAHKVLIHCFSGSLNEAKALTSLGCFISLSGIITFKKPGELVEVARSISLDKILIETDSPYLAPHPYRGQRNEPAYLVHTLKALALARNECEETISRHILENSVAFFGLNIS
jgi:TatD DNase family protein